jgi:hypothetical protein
MEGTRGGVDHSPRQRSPHATGFSGNRPTDGFEDESMKFEECLEGDYRIFVGAVESTRGDGWIAAVVVNRVNGAPSAQGRQAEAWRDDSLACGYRWPSPNAAIHYAMNRAREVVRSRPHLLAC